MLQIAIARQFFGHRRRWPMTWQQCSLRADRPSQLSQARRHLELVTARQVDPADAAGKNDVASQCHRLVSVDHQDHRSWRMSRRMVDLELNSSQEQLSWIVQKLLGFGEFEFRTGNRGRIGRKFVEQSAHRLDQHRPVVDVAIDGHLVRICYLGGVGAMIEMPVGQQHTSDFTIQIWQRSFDRRRCILAGIYDDDLSAVIGSD